MPCYFPLHAYRGKSNEVDKIKITFRRGNSWRGVKLDLPCGQCIGCRLERSRQWAVRCMHEASLYEDNSFLTLTYDDAHLPSNLSLVKSHFQDFVKRLRKSIAPKRVRYYHCGEYGDTLGRPHYHALLFNHDFEDKKFFSTRGGNTVYSSEELSRLWPKGFAVTGGVSFDSAAYVARYIMKKVTGDFAGRHYGDRLPEYTTMSRRPGIGAGWFSKYAADVFPLDRVVVRGKETRPPRFYDRLLQKVDRALYEKIKIDREMSCNYFVNDVLSDGRVVRVSDSSTSRLAVKESVKRAEISTLMRPLG
ncbi:MAG: replication initiator protein [Microvirus sp.]|nr:MAG: replication initiator protein [Microvirus sp.]